MNKDKLSSWTLALSVILILGGWAGANNPDFQTTIAGSAGSFLLGVVLAFVTWWLRSEVRKEQQASRDETAPAARSAPRPVAAAPRPAARASARVVRQKAFPVAGVTFRNDDGTSRQDILREICGGMEDGSATAWLEWFQYKGEDAYRVMTAEGCVGNVRRCDIREVVTAVGASDVELQVEYFETDDGRELYRADIMADIG